MLKKAKLKSKTLISRLGGVSAFGFGVSLKLPEPDRNVVREVLTFLEDRRALYVAAIWEQPDHVMASVMRMRDELTNALKRLSEKSPASAACRLMRAACREFVDKIGPANMKPMDRRFNESVDGERFLIALGSLRATFGQQVAFLAHLYEIDLEENLVSILPPELKSEDRK